MWCLFIKFCPEPHCFLLCKKIYCSATKLSIWFSWKVMREKSIYHTLNMLSIDVTKKCLVAEGWSPVFATKQVPLIARWFRVHWIGCFEFVHHVWVLIGLLTKQRWDLICADSGCIAAGNIWFQFTSWRHFPDFAHKRVATYIFSDKQIHFFVSGDCWCIWVSFS